MVQHHWTDTDIPSQRGKNFVVTGTGGLGCEIARALAQAGGDVVIAGHDPENGAQAIRRIKASYSGARINFEKVDLAHLDSVAEFADRLGQRWAKIDALINNDGVKAFSPRQTTVDGFELQFATNYLGHFALTARLMQLLQRSTRPRVITRSSLAAHSARMAFDDLQAEHVYNARFAYNQSKLACLLFTLELQRRSDASDWGITSMASHPGFARTALLDTARDRFDAQRFIRTYLWFLAQPAARGALPTLFAATDPSASGGSFYGPRGVAELRGLPGKARLPDEATSSVAASKLWMISEGLAKVRFNNLAKHNQPVAKSA